MTDKHSQDSTLVIACEYHHMEIVEMLLEYKADINKCQTESETPLFQACTNGYAKVLDKLVNYEQT